MSRFCQIDSATFFTDKFVNLHIIGGFHQSIEILMPNSCCAGATSWWCFSTSTDPCSVHHRAPFRHGISVPRINRAARGNIRPFYGGAMAHIALFGIRTARYCLRAILQSQDCNTPCGHVRLKNAHRQRHEKFSLGTKIMRHVTNFAQRLHIG